MCCWTPSGRRTDGHRVARDWVRGSGNGLGAVGVSHHGCAAVPQQGRAGLTEHHRVDAMQSWPAPNVPALPGRGPQLRLYDSADRQVRPVSPGQTARMYVCGITPYDATHLGHAATYVTFDLVGRVLRDAGHEVTYVQNITDVDDPLLERANRDGVDWQDLAAEEIALFREDMTALAVIPPDHYVGV